MTDNMIAELKRYNIKFAIASGPVQMIQQYQALDSKKFIGGCYFSPRHAFPDTAKFIELIKNGTVKVLGELGLQYAGLTLSDSLMVPFLNICNRYGIPIALHTGLGDTGTPYSECCPNFRNHLGNPQAIEEVLVKYPNLKVQLMHAGWPYLQETKAILYMYPQVNVDIAVLNWALPIKEFHHYLEQLIDAGFSKRIMYGSDQMVWNDVFKISIDNIESADFLSAHQKDDIFYNNAKAFFNLKE
ncbi:MAG: amidohydrolase family protein [Ferruginibacter sp.]